MRQDKNKAFSLRKEGKTYQEISRLLQVSIGTLSEWFKDQEWSKGIKESNIKKHVTRSTERLKKMNAARRIILDNKYRNAEDEAVRDFKTYKNSPLFMAGLMVYAGEGDKVNRFNIRLANSEFYLHLIFIRFLEEFLRVKREEVKFWLLLYPDHNIEESIAIWSEKLNIHKKNFHKSQVIIGKEKSKKLQYGVGNSIISNVALKKKLLKWLELCREDFK